MKKESSSVNAPKLVFRNRKISGKNVLYAACPASEALFELLKPRKFIEPGEMVHIHKMGFEWEITGDVKEFAEESEILAMNKVDGFIR